MLTTFWSFPPRSFYTFACLRYDVISMADADSLLGLTNFSFQSKAVDE